MGEKDLSTLLKSISPKLHVGEYVFCTIHDISNIKTDQIIMLFKEEEKYTIILEKSIADEWKLEYSFIASWITLTVHSSLEAIGLTAAFSTVLAKENISCNVIAGYYHDHIFVEAKEGDRAMEVLRRWGI